MSCNWMPDKPCPLKIERIPDDNDCLLCLLARIARALDKLARG